MYIITSIRVHPVRLNVIKMIMSVSTCKIAVILYILNIINIFDDPFHTKTVKCHKTYTGVWNCHADSYTEPAGQVDFPS